MSIIGIRIISTVVIIISVFLLIKNENAHKNRLVILFAIEDYMLDCIDNYNYNYEPIYEYMEPYKKTLLRVWDWSYKNILPPEKLEIIKPYIQSHKEITKGMR